MSRHGYSFTDDELEHMRVLLEEDKMSYKEVARTMGCSDTAVRTRFPGRGWSKIESGQHGQVVRRSLGLV